MVVWLHVLVLGKPEITGVENPGVTGNGFYAQRIVTVLWGRTPYLWASPAPCTVIRSPALIESVILGGNLG